VNLLANCSYSLIAPFYPAEAEKKGVPELALGLVFSSYSVSMFVFAPVYKFMLDKFGSKN
jgi:MFS family permease